ncbi:hypothetical protein [Patiriisocius sp. Uisw_017]|uniref:hypothetical protein n=1 Tax=Patiriisocius sp. Uisw_017 TaxID=3230968 RepID=UPI0039ECC34B
MLSAKQINPNLKIISRAKEETSYRKMKLAGANNVVLPDKIGGHHMVSLAVVSDLIIFLDNLSISGIVESMSAEQVSFENVCPNRKELPIKGLDIRQ